jgi:hypothetical protein
MFAAHLAADISKTGQLVISSNMEDPLAQVVRPRFEAAGADLTKIEFVQGIYGLPDGFEQVEELVRKMKPALFLMDPIAAHLRVSIFNDQEVRTVLSPLSKLAAETGTAFVFIHHVVKNFTGGYALRAVGGSGGGLPGAARAVYIFGSKSKGTDERFLATAKFNLNVWPKAVAFEVEDHEFVIGKGKNAQMLSAGSLIVTDDEDKTTAEAILEGSMPSIAEDSSPKKALAAASLTTYLADGPQPSNELREDMLQEGHTWKTVRNAAEAIGIEKVRVGFGGSGYWVWALPPGHPALSPIAAGLPVAGDDEPVQDEPEDGVQVPAEDDVHVSDGSVVEGGEDA